MRRLALPLLAPFLCFALLEACSDSDEASSPGVDAGIDVNVGNADTGSSTPPADGGDAATSDATTSDAAGDGGPVATTLFAHIGGKLVRASTTTGELTEVGTTAQPYLPLAWDDAARTMRVILDVYSPLGPNGETPKLGTIDLCTGVFTEGPAITVGGARVRRAEGLARDPATGIFYITYGIAGTAANTQYLSESNGTIDITTGVVTKLGDHQTYQDDGDYLGFVGGVLHLLDVASANGAGSLYRLDKTTGATTVAAATGPKVLRFANDPWNGVVYAAYGEANFTKRGIATLNTTTGAFTPIGAELAGTAYPGENFAGLEVAPTPVCN